MPGFGLLLVVSGLRVASLNLCTDEYLLLLAKPGEIVSVSRLAQDPAESPLWRQARAYPSNRGAIEQVIGQRPSLLLTMGGGGRSTGAIAARNDFSLNGYGGACPPEGSGAHRYVFTVYAMPQETLALDETASGAMVGYMASSGSLARATLTAIFGR